MPKFKADAKEFSLSVTHDGNQYKATIPKVLHERLGDAEEIHGSFSLSKDKIVLQEEYRVISVDRLLSQWWQVPEEHQDAIRKKNVMDWDEILCALGIHIDDYEGKQVVVGDFNDTEFDTLHISFIED